MIEFSLLLLDTWLIGTGAQFFKYIQSREASNWKECFIEGLAHTLMGRNSAAFHIPFLPSFLLTIYQKVSLAPSIFVTFFLLVWHNSWQKWLKEDRVYLDSQSKGMRSFAVGGRHGRASKRCLVTATVRKQRTRDTDAQLALFFLFRSAHGMGPFSVRGGHSSTINLNPLINMPRKLFP